MSDQYVVVTHYQPPGKDRRPVVHVWGPWPTREVATAAKRRMHREAEREYGETADEITFWVRKIFGEEHG